MVLAMTTYSRTALALGILLSVFLVGDLWAIKDEANQDRWEKPCTAGPDAEVPGFLVNLGPTGARGVLTAKSFVVKYVFKGSPASGKLKIDDEITGANGKSFATHTFSGRSETGIIGPIQDMGLAIEDSEGGDGILALSVKRGGKAMEVKVTLEKLGRFADSFPVNCEKTDLLKKRAYDYLMDHSDGVSSQGRCVTILSMLSSDDRKVFSEGKRRAKEWDKVPGKDTWSWHLGFQAMTLAEYYLITKDKSVLNTLEEVLGLLRRAQWKGPNIRRWPAKEGQDQAVVDEHQARYEGGFGHGPYPLIVERAGGVGKIGGGGYGPMQRPTYLAILAWQLGKQCGIEIDHPGLEQAFTFVDYGTTAAGNTAYGGEFTLNNGPIDSARWKKATRNGNSHKSGMAYLIYKLSPERSESKDMMKLHLQNVDASYMDMPDGHACPLMGLVWGWAGVYASPDKALKKKMTTYYKAWLNMARCHGSESYVILPGRNYADGSYYRGNIRNHTTGSVAFLYSYSSPKLQLQGGASVVKASAPTRTAAKPGKAVPKRHWSDTAKKPAGSAARAARTLSEESHAVLIGALGGALAKLSAAKALKPVAIPLSKVRIRVELVEASEDGTFTFRDPKSKKTVSYALKDLSARDHATLAIYLTVCKPTNDAQALAGVFLEVSGNTKSADSRFESAGTTSREKLEALFEK